MGPQEGKQGTHHGEPHCGGSGGRGEPRRRLLGTHETEGLWFCPECQLLSSYSPPSSSLNQPQLSTGEACGVLLPCRKPPVPCPRVGARTQRRCSCQGLGKGGHLQRKTQAQLGCHDQPAGALWAPSQLQPGSAAHPIPGTGATLGIQNSQLRWRREAHPAGLPTGSGGASHLQILHQHPELPVCHSGCAPPAPLAQEPPARLALQRPPAGPRSLFSLCAGRRGMGGRVPPRALNLPNPLLLMLPLCRQGSWLGTLCVSGSHRVAFGASPASPRKRLPGGQVGPALQQPSALQTQAFLGLISWDGVS